MSEPLHYLFVLVAASAVGKNALIDRIKNEQLWGTVSKYSTRDNRGLDDDVIEIKSLISDEDAIKSKDETEDIQKRDIRYIRMEYIKSICGEGKGVVYYKNNNFYSICTNEIIEKLKESNLAVIISDFHVIRQLRKNPNLASKVRVMYIASTVDERELLKRYKNRENTNFDEQSEETMQTVINIEKMCSVLSSAARLKFLTKIEEVLPLLNEQWNSYVPYFDTIKTRALNIRMLYNRYIDNIADIDYVILNFYNLEYMFGQTRNIIKNVSLRKKLVSPPVFIVCAALSSGKATLMEIIGDLGVVDKNIEITTKYAQREKRKTDGRDGMKAIGATTAFSTVIQNPNNIWEWRFHTGRVAYAVDHSEIKEKIERGVAQIFISNMSQIEIAKQLYPENAVILYLHATYETETKKHIEKKRKEEIFSEIRNSLSTDNVSFDEIERIFENDVDWQNKLQHAIKSDLEEIRTVHNDFLLHNHRIDHVLLNTGTHEDMVEQMRNLIKHYTLDLQQALF